MDTADMRWRMARARVGRLATASATGVPHVVPVCFALLGDELVTAVDSKPKRSLALRRTANILENGKVALLVDEYSEDWTRLWWVRVDAHASIVEEPTRRQEALRALAGKYPQYKRQSPPGPVFALTECRWTGWSARDVPAGRGG